MGTHRTSKKRVAAGLKPGPRLCFVLAAVLFAAGCAITGGETSAPSLALPALPSLGDVASIGAGKSERPVGSATEVYSRVASGAMSCWFGAAGPLKKDYIYHAEADAPSRGGKSEITIHVRDPAQPNPRGAKAYRINIEPAGETASLATENLKMPDAYANAMTSDVGRWSKGDQGCAGASTAAAAGWAPQTPLPAAPAKKVVASAKKKTKSVAAQPATTKAAAANTITVKPPAP